MWKLEMKNWQVKVSTIHKLDGDVIDEFEFFTQAKGIMKSDYFQIFYKESEITAMDGVLTKVEIFQDYVVLVRSGNCNQSMRFIVGEIQGFDYETPYGNISLGVKTVHLKIDRDDKQVHSVNLAYEIWAQEDRKLGDYQLRLSIQEA